MTSDDIDLYMNYGYAIECPQIVLRQNTETSPMVYEGPGSIYQTPDGELAFKFYARAKGDFDALSRLLGSNAPKVGQLIPSDQYFSLKAVSMRGEEWFGERILLDVSQGVDGDQIVAGRPYELINRADEPGVLNAKAHVSLNFAEPFDFPGNAPRTVKTFLKNVQTSFSGDWSPAVFPADGLRFELHKRRGAVFLSASSETAVLPVNLDMRICEALEFTFFVPARWVVREVREGGRYTAALRPFPKIKAKQSGRPPIKCSSVPSESDVWRLFAKYLEYVLPYPESRWHPLSEDVHVVVTGDAGSLDAGLLALSVSVEGALSVGFPKLATPGDGLRQQIVEATQLVSDSSLDGPFKKRLEGSITAMNTPRAKDRLRALVDVGLIRKELMDCWAKIRNSTVHASDTDPSEISDVYARYQSALTLFNELVILIIGYTGQYTDYSSLGWPRRKFDKTFQEHQSALRGDPMTFEDTAESTLTPTETHPRPTQERTSTAVTSEQSVGTASTTEEAAREENNR
jgi:hypothetical protein